MVGQSWDINRRKLWSIKMSGSNNPMFGKKRPKYVRDAMRKGLLGKPSAFRGKHHKNSSINILSNKAKNNWKNGKYTITSIKKWYMNNNFGVTNPEQICFCILRELNSSFKFTGNYSFHIGRFSPDFTDKKNKKIIEVYGSYWHSKQKAIKKDKRRKLLYKENGYKFLIIHDYELKNNIEKTIEKINQFI